MNMKSMMGLALAVGFAVAAEAAAKKPNILWITCEDTGPDLGCYGDAYAVTPNLDALAARGMRYRLAWSTAPVCAPARTTIITGVYPPALGAEHMRSEVALPAFMKLYPQFLREQGYYCSNNSKTDYNVTPPGQVWDDSSGQAHWRNRRPDQPFFAIFNDTGTHESQVRKRPHEWKHDPAKAPVPAYHPDTPEVRQDWAQYYDNVTAMDAKAGKILAELKADGLADDTIVLFCGDHGPGMPRCKRWPYDSGLHVALLLHVPPKYQELAPEEYKTGGVSARPVGFIDIAPTLLSLAGVKPPEWMQGHAFMGPFATPPPKYQFGFRGRMDERYDLVRSVRNERYVYLRQYLPHLIYGQFIDFMFQTPTTRLWKQLYDEGKLQPPQTYFWQTKPFEELYDLENDPDETKNLAGSAEHRAVLEELRQANRAHLLAIRDTGFLSEAEVHRRADAAGRTIYEFGHDPALYPLERILDMADIASLRAPGTEPQLLKGLADPDSGVRYWAALGLLMRGQNGFAAGRAALGAALQDESPSVRIVAAQALGQHGNDEELKRALDVLKALAPADANGAYTAMLALNAIESLGPKAAPLLETVRTLQTKDPKAPGRANSYVARLVADMTGSKPAADGAEKKPARPRKARPDAN